MEEQMEDFVIDKPYTLTSEDIGLITKASPNNNSHKDWEKACLKEFKERIKNYLRDKQNKRCAYCRTIIQEGECPSELDHIVEKSKRPDWMYIPINLCFSCKRCNTAKGHTHDIISDYNIESYPLESKAFLIINPYIDKYSDHIRIIDGILYKGLTMKGSNTIEYCKLNRYELACDRAEALIRQDESNMVRLLLLLIDKQRQALIDNWDKFVERIKLMDPIIKYKQTHNEIQI